jgi:hypothetical protein
MAGTPGVMAARGEDNATWPTVRLARQLCFTTFTDCNIQREKLKFNILSQFLQGKGTELTSKRKK